MEYLLSFTSEAEQSFLREPHLPSSAALDVLVENFRRAYARPLARLKVPKREFIFMMVMAFKLLEMKLRCQMSAGIPLESISHIKPFWALHQAPSSSVISSPIWCNGKMLLSLLWKYVAFFFSPVTIFSGGILWSLFGWFFKSLFIFVWTDKSKRRKVHRRSRWENFFPNPIPKADLEQAGSIFYEKWCSIKFYYWGRCSPWEKLEQVFPQKVSHLLWIFDRIFSVPKLFSLNFFPEECSFHICF